ncbi:MAG: site-2 protease family protein [Okeania sp. SIO2F4]|uniref:site-2 protease family protein n=1 Tax=Okeania sp. SIO2F4 TaxID=2607790 RepID=UPI00142ABC67|nr:site-2 protease family protein [Okeania sp. SIO2F4]NES04218.1 site-2 protease family protein [Okeania sp. SIO2F4]
MYTTSENTTTVIVALIALGILGWGYYRARPYGKTGILAWLQSVVLMAPWLLFFALFAAGIYLNLVLILFLLIACTGLYIYLGRQLRIIAAQEAENKPEIQSISNPSKPDSSEEKTQLPNIEKIENEEEKKEETLEFIPIPTEDLQKVKDIFGIDTFFATETIPYQEGAIFKGNLRGDTKQVHTKLSAKLAEKLGDRYRLFLLESPEGKPVVIILPSKNDPLPATTSQKILAVILLLATIATSFEAGGLLLGFDFFNQPMRYQEALPVVIGLWIVLGGHEIAHQVLAKRHNVRFSWPFFLPAWQIGSFGSVNRFESTIPNRKVLFDVAFAGPAAGGIISLAMLLGGLLLSHEGSLFQMPSEFFRASVLVGSLARAILGPAVNQNIVDVHPLAIMGWLGLVITAINLMPAGQLDGGRIVQAIYGRKVAGKATFFTFIVLAIASLVNPLALYWAIIILVLQRNLERPCLNELTEPDDARAALCLLALFLAIATLFPLTPALAGRLGIGG